MFRIIMDLLVFLILQGLDSAKRNEDKIRKARIKIEEKYCIFILS